MIEIILILLIFILNIIFFKYRFRRNKKLNVPGMKSTDPKLGNLIDISRAGSLHEYLIKLHKKFGPIASFYWGQQPIVSIASPQAFYETRRLFDRPVSLFAAFKPLIGDNSIQYANGDIARYRRKNHYDAALSGVSLREEFFGLFENVLRDKIAVLKQDGMKPIALHSEMLSMAIRSIVLAAFGSSLLFGDEKKIEQAYNTCWHEMEMRIQGETSNAQRENEFNEAKNYFMKKIKEIIDERRQKLGYHNKCFIDYLLIDDEYVLNEEHICSEVITMFVGGFHTTGNLLTWILYYLAREQQIQEKLYDELIQTYNTEFPSFEQIDEMTYLSNVINESLRISVLAPWAARISMDNNIKVCGRIIPAGTPIIQALGVVLKDENIWNNSDEFNPDRFNLENKKKLSTFAFSPFGFSGKRICPGYRFAQYETSLFVSGLIRAFHITLVDPANPVVPVHGLVTSPRDEIFVYFKSRN